MKKRWQRKRPGESERAFHERLNRTCFACGHESPSVAACDAHEATCAQAHSQGRRKKK